MRFFLLSGFALWLGATVALRFVGQFLFVPPVVWLTYLITVPLIVIVVLRLLARRPLSRSERALAVISLALPGMLLDILSVALAPAVFPNIPDAARGNFAAWLLWAYALALLTVFLPIPRDARTDARTEASA